MCELKKGKKKIVQVLLMPAWLFACLCSTSKELRGESYKKKYNSYYVNYNLYPVETFQAPKDKLNTDNYY